MNFSETFFSARGEIAKELLFSKITFSAVLSLLTRGKKVRTKKILLRLRITTLRITVSGIFEFFIFGFFSLHHRGRLVLVNTTCNCLKNGCKCKNVILSFLTEISLGKNVQKSFKILLKRQVSARTKSFQF